MKGGKDVQKPTQEAGCRVLPRSVTTGGNTSRECQRESERTGERGPKSKKTQIRQEQRGRGVTTLWLSQPRRQRPRPPGQSDRRRHLSVAPTPAAGRGSPLLSEVSAWPARASRTTPDTCFRLVSVLMSTRSKHPPAPHCLVIVSRGPWARGAPLAGPAAGAERGRWMAESTTWLGRARAHAPRASPDAALTRAHGPELGSQPRGRREGGSHTRPVFLVFLPASPNTVHFALNLLLILTHCKQSFLLSPS